MPQQLPTLELTDWKPARDTLHQYARIIGKIRSRYVPKSKHWWHITLGVSVRGITTTPFPVAGQNLELTLDLATHRVVIDSSDGLTDLALPEGACWHTEGWTGTVLPCKALLASGRPFELLLDYLRSLQDHGARLMV